MTLANKITILRIVLIPVYIIALLQNLYPWPVILFTFMIVSDALDGFVARHRKQITRLGSFLDPLADKLLMFSSYLLAAYLKMIPLWIFVLILSRDLLIVIGWMVNYFITESTEVKPRVLGKITTIFQMVAMWFILLNVPPVVEHVLLTLTAVVTAVSALDYVLSGSKRLNAHA